MDNSLILEDYYAQNAKKLRGMVDRILSKFGGICQKDWDDFYSLANEVLIQLLERYDGRQSFDGFLYAGLSNKIKTEITGRNRLKRGADRITESIDAQVGEDCATLGDFLVSDFDLERELSYLGEEYLDETMQQYLSQLSKLQKSILTMLTAGYDQGKIREQLNLSEKQYYRNLNDLKSYEKTRYLRMKESKKAAEEENEVAAKKAAVLTQEISKETVYPISACIDMIEECVIRDDHPLQRQAEQWNNQMKGNLIVTILHKYPIPSIVVAEQSDGGMTTQWLIDGKQRLSNLFSYKKNKFKISKNVERPVITYQSTVKTETGQVVRDELGNPKYEMRAFDVRGKYFRDLPVELQKKFDSYNIHVVIYLSCCDDELEYHIRRYNAVKPMSVAQKGITHLGNQLARVVKSISEMSFFKNKGNYRASDFINGTMDRVITESLMAIHFLNDWKKRNEDICDYLKENARVSHFNGFEELIGRLDEILTEETAALFNTRDSFLWFALFSRFSKYGLEDREFAAFLLEFKKVLHEKAIQTVTYDQLNEKSTKDKNVIIQKLDFLESLMDDYLHIKKEKIVSRFVINNKKFTGYINSFMDTDLIKIIDIRPETDQVRAAVQSLMMVCGIEDLSDRSIQDFILQKEALDALDEKMDDTLLYLGILDEWSLNVDNNSSIFQKETIPALINTVAYACNLEEDGTAIKWFENYVGAYPADGCFTRSQYENYNKMAESLDRYIRYEQRKKWHVQPMQ